MNTSFNNTNGQKVRMFIHNAKQNSIFPEVCDNLCVEAANSKATFFWCREVLDQIATSQFDWSSIKYQHIMDQFNPIN